MKPAYRTLPKGWLTVAESALLLGVSRVSVYKALNVGRLEYRTIEGRKCIEAKDLKNRFWGSSQRVADRPLHGLARLRRSRSDQENGAFQKPPSGKRHINTPMAGLSDAELGAYCDEHLGDDAMAAAIAPLDDWIAGQRQEPAWDRIAARLNEYLGAWSAPPWTAQQANTVAMALAMAQEGAGG